VREVPQGDGDALTFGAYLRQSRTLRELSLEEVATATKLPARIIAALEGDDHAALQDRAYALLVARSCATAIGLDPEETALRLEEELQARAPAAARPGPLWRRAWDARPREPLVWAVVFGTLIAMAALLIFRK
jgi:cytoskeleton protein RodZ